MTIPVLNERDFGRFFLFFFFWHWGLLLFGLLPYPEPRLIAICIALFIDLLCWIYFFYWVFNYRKMIR